MGNVKTAILKLINRDGQAQDVYTLPQQGPADPDFSIPVVLARGVLITQTYVPIPSLNKTSSDLFSKSIVKILSINPARRYLKVVNNGNSPVELWTTIPAINDAGRSDDVLRGEVLFANGYGIIESDTCRTGEIYATAVNGASGLSVMEG